MWFTRVSIGNPVMATMVMLAFVVLGLFSYQRLSVDQFPNIDFPTVVITIDYPGASPEIVESEVTKKVEEAVNTVAGINSLYSRSYEGTSVVIVEFNLDIDGRKAFYERTNYFALQRQYNQELSAQIDKKGLGAEARKIFDSLDAADAGRDAIGQSDPLTINSFQADAAINAKQWLMNRGIPEIVRLTPGLKSGEAFWNASRAYWIRRNNEMVRNIKRLAAEFAGKRLVVLCGFEHRYYLRSHLYDWDEQPGYVVKEYWEY